jgi:hypothetical protein
MKYILTFFFIFYIVNSYGQDSFDEKYTATLTIEESVKGEWINHSIVVTFNYGKNKDINIYFKDLNQSFYFFRQSSWNIDYANDASKYEIASFIDEDGTELYIQRFLTSKKCLRVIFKNSGDVLVFN